MICITFSHYFITLPTKKQTILLNLTGFQMDEMNLTTKLKN